MGRIKTYTEETFDNTFQEKTVIDYNQYNEITKKTGYRDKKIMSLLKDFGVDGKNCLDVCPGTGRWLTYLKSNRASYLSAIDISQKSIDKCIGLCDKIQKADVESEKFDFESNFFDLVISFMALEHIRDPSLYLSEIMRVVKNDGLIIMTIPNIVSFISRIRVLFGIMPQAVTNDPTHIKFYTHKELIKIFEPYNQKPKIIPTSFSINPLNAQSLRIPSNKLTKSLDDHLLFYIRVKK